MAGSWLAPLSMVIDWPTTKPAVAATGMTVSPTCVAVPARVLPAVPTDAMTAVSLAGPLPIVTAWPAANSATPATFIFGAPAAAPSGRVVTGCTTKSVQRLSSS